MLAGVAEAGPSAPARGLWLHRLYFSPLLLTLPRLEVGLQDGGDSLSVATAAPGGGEQALRSLTSPLPSPSPPPPPLLSAGEEKEAAVMGKVAMEHPASASASAASVPDFDGGHTHGNFHDYYRFNPAQVSPSRAGPVAGRCC